MDANWLIWSDEHRGWWRPARSGYTQKKAEAGRYSFDEAVRICTEANAWKLNGIPEETMLPDYCMPQDPKP